MPRGTAAQTASRSAMTASSMVTRNRSFSWLQTGVLYHREVTRSPRSTFPSQLAYWTESGRSRPSFCRSCWSCAGEAAPLSPSPPARIVRAGSPGTIQKSANTRIVATRSVGRKSSTRRSAYLPLAARSVLRHRSVGVPPHVLELLHDLLGAGHVKVLDPVVHHAARRPPAQRHH